MSHLTQLKQRIAAIKKTSKITHAMRLMSMSLYAKLERQNVAVSRYRKRIATLFTELNSYAPTWKNQILFPEDILDSSPLFVIIASTQGLCGSFNSNLARYFEQNFLFESHQTPSFITVGTKAHELLKKKRLTDSSIHHYEKLISSNVVEIADGITTVICKQKQPFSSVNLFTNYPKNFFTQVPEKTLLLPLSMETSQTKKPPSPPTQEKMQKTFGEEPIWEQSKYATMDAVGVHYLKSQLLGALLDSLLAEHAARFVAMDSSTRNAEKYLERLTHQYNKLRQSLITREVAELSAGFTSL